MSCQLSLLDLPRHFRIEDLLSLCTSLYLFYTLHQSPHNPAWLWVGTWMDISPNVVWGLLVWKVGNFSEAWEVKQLTGLLSDYHTSTHPQRILYTRHMGAITPPWCSPPWWFPWPFPWISHSDNTPFSHRTTSHPRGFLWQLDHIKISNISILSHQF